MSKEFLELKDNIYEVEIFDSGQFNNLFCVVFRWFGKEALLPLSEDIIHYFSQDRRDFLMAIKKYYIKTENNIVTDFVRLED